MSRSKWKGPFFDYSLLQKYRILLKKKSKNKYAFKINLPSRNSTILPQFIGLKFNIYNGKKYMPLIISEEMVGHKIGEFVPTRTNFKPKKNKK